MAPPSLLPAPTAPPSGHAPLVASGRSPASSLPPRLLAGLSITGGLVLVALVSLVWTPAPPGRMAIRDKLLPPSSSGWLGTDHFGRDILSMLMAGAPNALLVALLSVAAGGLVGTAIGLAAAARPGPPGAVLMRACDVLFAVPPIVSAMMLAVLLGPGRASAILAIATFMVPVFARVARAGALQVWARPFVLAARGAGKGAFRITLGHVLPNVAGPLAVQASVQLGLAILTEAGLSFLGLGAPPPAPSWGRMLADAQTHMAAAPWVAIAPGAAIALAVLGFNLLGDGIGDRLDPRRRP